MPQVLKESKRLAIVDATARLLVSKGYDKLRMREVARKTNMTVGNIYRYYNNLDDLRSQVIEHMRECPGADYGVPRHQVTSFLLECDLIQMDIHHLSDLISALDDDVRITVRLNIERLQKRRLDAHQ